MKKEMSVKGKNIHISIAVILVVALVAGYVGFMIGKYWSSGASYSPESGDTCNPIKVKVLKILEDRYGGKYGLGVMDDGFELTFEFDPSDEPTKGDSVYLCVRDDFRWWIVST